MSSNVIKKIKLPNNVTYDIGGGVPTFTGTKAEWNALTSAQKAEYEIVNLTDDYDILVELDDTTPSTSKVFSSSKVDTTYAKKTELSNPNLLDNPWFTVNQRGFTSETATNGYFVDRWVRGLAPTITQNADKSLAFTGTGANGSIIDQYLESDYTPTLLGKTITFSIMLSDGTVFSAIDTLPLSAPSSTVAYCLINDASNDFFATALYWSATSEKFIAQIGVKTGKTLNIKAVKLELGTVSTLAMDTAPNYELELAKCKLSTADANDTYANKGHIDICTWTSGVQALTSATSCTITNSAISSTSVLEVFYDNTSGTDPVAKVTGVSGTTATIGFKALTENTTFYLRVTNL